MPSPKIIIRSKGQLDREVQLSGDATIGRAFDNTICIDDAGISRYHAIIEQRDNDFWLSDLGSRNGTAVNQETIISKRKLEDGDSISIGDRATIDFHCAEKAPASLRESTNGAGERKPSDSAASTPVIAPAEKTPRLVIIAALAGLVIIVGIVLILSGVFRSSSDGAARIVSPQTGTTLRGRETVRVEVENQKKIERIIFLLDGVEIASAQFPPYDVEIDPAALSHRVRNLAASDHILTLTIEDKDGNRKPQPETVLLSFETNQIASGESEPITASTSESDARPAATVGVDVASLCRSLAAQISGKSWYTFDAEFTEQIRLRTAEYRVSVIDDARRYRREIGNAFGAKGLPLSLGFVMAMSQSRFRNAASDSEAGMWKVPRRIAVEQGYVAADESASTFNDAKRSSEIAAAYMKELINVFGMDDFLYAIACYGMPLSQAAQLRARLEETDPTARRDFWKMVRAGIVPREGADRVARFFAAGIVGENPRAFGVGGEPLSSLY
ncbi:MAG: FHA domain-containing protein [Acidobacteriota bacterium]